MQPLVAGQTVVVGLGSVSQSGLAWTEGQLTCIFVISPQPPDFHGLGRTQTWGGLLTLGDGLSDPRLGLGQHCGPRPLGTG